MGVYYLIGTAIKFSLWVAIILIHRGYPEEGKTLIFIAGAVAFPTYFIQKAQMKREDSEKRQYGTTVRQMKAAKKRFDAANEMYGQDL